MATNNAINLNASGIAKYDGSGAFSAVTVSQHQPLVGAASNGITSLGAMTNGQLVIGNTLNDPSIATITPGTGISVTNGAGSIQLDVTGSGMRWTVVNAPTNLGVNNGYGANSGGATAFTLPAASAVGATVSIVGMAIGWTVAQGAGQQIHIGSSSTTLGAGGSLASTNAGDCVTLVCLVADTIWYARSVIGNVTVV